METLNNIVQTVNSYLSDYVLLVLLVVLGVLFTVRTRGVQFRCFGEGARKLFKTFSLHGGKHTGGITSFQALATAVSEQVGTGNIVGTCSALLIGGPGAIFWMWVIALLGMATSYAEAVLAQKTRVVEEDGTVHGGPVFYIKLAFKGRLGRFLCILFALAAVLANGFFGMMVHSNSIAVTSAAAFHIPSWTIGVILTAIVGIIAFGGLQRLAAVTEKIVPIMAVVYIAGGLLVLVVHATQVPAAFALIVASAFNPQAAVGGTVFGIFAAMTTGAKRGLFSNCAGMGSTPHAHAMAKVSNPHDQGVVAMMGVFIDTIIVVTITALVVVSALFVGDGPFAVDYQAAVASGINAANMTQIAFGTVFGAAGGNIFVALCLLLFAFSTVISCNLYASLNVEYLFGKRGVLPFRIIMLAFIFCGTLLENAFVWGLCDFFLQLMVIPNALALIALSGVVACFAKKGLLLHADARGGGDG